jgi:glycosyltransferase involved in cell wall biosynthesis
MPLAPVYATIALAFKLRRKPVLFTVHNVTDHEGSVIFRAASRLLFSLADHLIVHTATNQQTLIHEYGIDPSRTSVIPHGSLDFQVTCSADREQIRHEMGFSNADKVVLFFGAIRPYKGLATALRAMAEVLKVLPKAKLLIAGKLWEPWDTYQNLIDELRLANHVKAFLDYIPSEDVHRYFCAADLTVLPYLHFDSQSGVGSTAVAFRTPMIVSGVGGLPELVQDPRFVVPPGDSAALGRIITDCLSTPEKLESMSRHLDSTAHELDWGAIAQNTNLLYERLIRANEVPVPDRKSRFLNLISGSKK